MTYLLIKRLDMLPSTKARVFKAWQQIEEGYLHEEQVAIKVVNLKHDAYCKGEVKTEFAIPYALKDNPNVVDVYEQSDNLSQIRFNNQLNPFKVIAFYTMELCPHGDLIDMLMKFDGPIRDYYFLKVAFAQILNGVHGMHTSKQSYAHCDIKCENILISKDYTLKVADFDTAQPIDKPIRLPLGTPGYNAPEQISCGYSLTRTYFGIQADIFSLGIVFFAMRFNTKPFQRAVESDTDWKMFRY